MNSTESPTCSVVDRDCSAPPGLAESHTRAECFACGLSVCTVCSSRRQYLHYGRRRLCNYCQIDYDGHNRTVLLRESRRMGYRIIPSHMLPLAT